ncbi:DUF4179 domain-containing protein [Clostridium sp.]|uniref:DUF4179 domain-containing protein n=1 Tax=Clostridium sp. TaxID=1506 RepID=UPI00352211B4
MSNIYFDDEKLKYENIEIPEELDFMIKKTLKEGQERRRFKTIYKYGIGIVSTFLVFVLLVNIFPTVAYAMSKVPGLDKLVELVTFDKGFDNAIEEGLVKEINFEEEQNGVKLKLNTIAGDWKRLWVGYEILGEIDLGVDVSVISEDVAGWSTFYTEPYSITNEEGGQESYIEISFDKFNEEFKLEFNIYDNEKYIESNLNKEYLASFSVPIKLEEEIFNSELINIPIDNTVINTEIGDIEIVSLKSSKTRSVMEFKLNSDIYDYMTFENPRFIDDKGNEYKISSFYVSKGVENNFVEFQGEIKEDIKSLTFIFDNLYYAGKDDRKIIVDLKNKVVEKNNYNFEFISLIGNELTLKADFVKSVSFENIILENGDDLISESGTSCIGDEDSSEYYVKSYLRINDPNVDKIELKIGWIMKSKIEGNSIELIEK